ncbi:MAG: cytidine deaminase [Desulfurococcaceae archaeon]
MLWRLVKEAERVLPNSYAPYSGVRVAAAILSESNKVHLGVNVENSSYGLTMCAERVAVSAMITAGDKKPLAIAVVTDAEKPIPPCGACRQVLAEFNPSIIVISYSTKSREHIIADLKQLFPQPFKLRQDLVYSTALF